jgi:hypothetical protein
MILVNLFLKKSGFAYKSINHFEDPGATVVRLITNLDCRKMLERVCEVESKKFEYFKNYIKKKVIAVSKDHSKINQSNLDLNVSSIKNFLYVEKFT